VPYDTTNSRSGLFYYQNKFQIDYECLGGGYLRPSSYWIQNLGAAFSRQRSRITFEGPKKQLLSNLSY
jgi:hypothetical protein